jgi:hypothetical protein
LAASKPACLPVPQEIDLNWKESHCNGAKMMVSKKIIAEIAKID